MKLRAISNCRSCKSSDLVDVLTLGEHFLGNAFTTESEPDPPKAPLDVVLCQSCSLLQLKHTVAPELLYSKYWYRSGINQTMTRHLHGIAHDAASRVNVRPDDIILDIGCNDGTLLNGYDQPRANLAGMDPAANILDMIQNDSIIKINDYFSAHVFHTNFPNRKAKIITSIAMFYDIDEPNNFVKDIKEILFEDGLWIVEVNSLSSMLQNRSFDMIGHEHLEYYCYTTFETLVNRHGLYVNDVTFNSSNGGSIRFFVSHKKVQTESCKNTKLSEVRQNLRQVHPYKDFAIQVQKLKLELLALVESILKKGERIYVYGASTRGNTILQFCGLDYSKISGAAERNPLKWGTKTPGTKILIMSEDEVRNARPEYLLILPFFYLEEFIKREREYLRNGGKFIVPLPELRVLDASVL